VKQIRDGSRIFCITPSRAPLLVAILLHVLVATAVCWHALSWTPAIFAMPLLLASLAHDCRRLAPLSAPLLMRFCAGGVLLGHGADAVFYRLDDHWMVADWISLRLKVDTDDRRRRRVLHLVLNRGRCGGADYAAIRRHLNHEAWLTAR
jgi:hypothetical protein